MTTYDTTDWTGTTEGLAHLEEAMAQAYADIEELQQQLDSGTTSPPPPPSGTTTSGASTFLDVTADFGGSVKNACAEAQSSGGPSPCVWLGNFEYPFTETIMLSRPISVRGGGRSTRLRHSGSFTGPLFRVNQAKRNGQYEQTSGSAPTPIYEDFRDAGGIEFRDFSIVDNDRNVANRQGMYLMSVDDMWMSNVSFGYLTGTALKLGADEADKAATSPTSGRIRESNFDRINIYRCGSGSPNGSPDIPALILQSSTGDGDGSNQNYWTHLRFVYNEGRMLISGRNNSNTLRRTIFTDTQLHALADNQSWNPSKYFPFDMVTLEGAVRETVFNGVFANGTKEGTAIFAMKGHPSVSEYPKRLSITDINVVNTAGDLLRVERGDTVSVEGTGLGSVSGAVINNKAGSGLARYYVHEKGINSPARKGVGLTGSGSFWHSGLSVPAA